MTRYVLKPMASERAAAILDLVSEALDRHRDKSPRALLRLLRPNPDRAAVQAVIEQIRLLSPQALERDPLPKIARELRGGRFPSAAEIETLWLTCDTLLAAQETP